MAEKKSKRLAHVKFHGLSTKQLRALLQRQGQKVILDIGNDARICLRIEEAESGKGIMTCFGMSPDSVGCLHREGLLRPSDRFEAFLGAVGGSDRSAATGSKGRGEEDDSDVVSASEDGSSGDTGTTSDIPPAGPENPDAPGDHVWGG